MIDGEGDEEYFCQVLDLLHETQWLYKFPVTEILIRNTLENFPDGWMSALRNLNNEELNELVVNKRIEIDRPESLLSFVEKCRFLDKLPPVISDDVEILPKSFQTGMSKKKQHEIVCLANLVQSQCEKKGIKTIVDLGAGLGYVCQLLNFLHNYRVLGLESNEKNVEAAKRKQREYYPASIDRVDYVCAKIDSSSGMEIRNFLKKSNGDVEEEFCLIGLHACGDLGVDACDLFSKIPSAKILILLSCCYHKMENKPHECTDKFRNFPISETLKNIFESSDRHYNEFLNRPFLRLACQEPAVRWNRMSHETHRQHAFHVLARAVLESFAHKNSIILKKRTRKATRNSQCIDFETYLQDAMLRYEFKCNDENSLTDTAEIRESILSEWKKVLAKLDDIEIYTGLQLMLQSPAESLILRDRRCWLVEMSYDTEIIPVTSRSLSPRSHAIVSRKK
ncbi:methyltransferase-like protein 25 isoform X2 [Venturia canescens]|nr:methyltransferase-like protein 25 isoform X2 [Venturia canescens]